MFDGGNRINFHSILKGNPFAWWKPIVTSKAISCRFREQYDNRTHNRYCQHPMILIKLSKTNSLFSLASYTNVNGIIPCFLARTSSFCTPPKQITARWMDSVIECHRVSGAKSIQAYLVPDARYFHIKYTEYHKMWNVPLKEHLDKSCFKMQLLKTIKNLLKQLANSPFLNKL